MRRRAAWGMVMLSLLGPLSVARTAAQDASFGCKVALLGSDVARLAEHSLLRAGDGTLSPILAKGGSWPSCPEARTSGLGYERSKPVRPARRRCWQPARAEPR